MNTETRLLATEMAETFDGADSCAWRIHHPGQLTIAEYRSLDRVDPRHITGLARVDTRPRPQHFECIGCDADGWLVRAELSDAAVGRLHHLPRIRALLELPFLRLVDEVTGYASPDPLASPCCTPRRARVVNVPPFPASHPDCDACNTRRDTPTTDH